MKQMGVLKFFLRTRAALGVVGIRKTRALASALIVIMGMTVSAKAFACQFNTDCQPGNTCLKQGYSLYGVCTGGINPGNSHDQQPVYNRLNPNDKTGDTCSFDTDCGIGRKCVKGNYSIKGACM